MIVVRLLILGIVITGAVLVASCTAPVAQPVVATPASAQPTSATQPTTATVKPTTPTPSGETQKLNLDEYFPTGRGRELVLQSCTGCHSFAPIITGQRTKERWESLKSGHRDKAAAINENDYNTLFVYLVENYNNTKPEPKLPEWFLKLQGSTGQ